MEKIAKTGHDSKRPDLSGLGAFFLLFISSGYRVIDKLRTTNPTVLLTMKTFEFTYIGHKFKLKLKPWQYNNCTKIEARLTRLFCRYELELQLKNLKKGKPLNWEPFVEWTNYRANTEMFYLLEALGVLSRNIQGGWEIYHGPFPKHLFHPTSGFPCYFTKWQHARDFAVIEYARHDWNLVRHGRVIDMARAKPKES